MTNMWSGKEAVIEMERACVFTFFCFNRPKLVVNLIMDGQKMLLGTIEDNFNICNLRFSYSIYGSNGMLRYKIAGCCLQCGIVCDCICCCCCCADGYKKAEFSIWDEAAQDYVGTVRRRGKGWVKNCRNDADNISVTFPQEATFEDRALLVCLGMFIDYMLFESGKLKCHFCE